MGIWEAPLCGEAHTMRRTSKQSLPPIARTPKCPGASRASHASLLAIKGNRLTINAQMICINHLPNFPPKNSKREAPPSPPSAPHSVSPSLRLSVPLPPCLLVPMPPAPRPSRPNALPALPNFPEGKCGEKPSNRFRRSDLRRSCPKDFPSKKSKKGSAFGPSPSRPACCQPEFRRLT